jgi:2-dehydro-3-deoxygluconokinase
MSGRLVCFGEMLVRLSAPQGEMLLQTPQLSAHIGGAEANVAICVSRLGGSAAMATVLPDNPLGHAARDELRRHGVDVSAVKFAPGRMGLYFLTPGAVLRPSEIVYDRAGSAFAEQAGAIAWDAALGGAAMLHVSGITPAVSATGGEAALKAVAAATVANIPVSFDGNYRAKLWEARKETGAPILRKLLEAATLAFIDERDIALVLGASFASRNAAAAAAFKAFPRLERIAATTRTTHAIDAFSLGATLHHRDGTLTQARPLELGNVVDRIGGGDAFAGGLIHGLLKGWPADDALTFALHTAAAKHGQVGDASHASESQIRALMGDGGKDVRR